MEPKSELERVVDYLGLIGLCVWFWVLVYYWIGSPLPGWIQTAVLK